MRAIAPCKLEELKTVLSRPVQADADQKAHYQFALVQISISRRNGTCHDRKTAAGSADRRVRL